MKKTLKMPTDLGFSKSTGRWGFILICIFCSFAYAATINDIQTIDGAQRQKIQSAIDGATNGFVGGGGGTVGTNVFTLVPTSFVAGVTMDLNTNSGLLFITNNGSQHYFSFTTNLIGPILVSGTASETNFATVNIPAGSIGSNGYVFISSLWERRTGSPGGVACRIRWGSGTATGAQLVESLSAGASNASLAVARDLFAANSHTNVVGLGTSGSFGIASSVAPVFLTDSTFNVLPVYFNALPNITTETNILWGVNVKVEYQK